MQLRSFSWLVASAMILTASISAASAGDLTVTFRATVDRAVVPSGERLTDDAIVGSEVTGRIVFSPVAASRDIEPAAGRGRTFWQTCVREIVISDPAGATFRGGTMFLQDGQVTLNASSQYCVGCSRTGPSFQTTSDAGEGHEYQPFRYLFAQSAPYVALDAEFAPTIRKMVEFSQGHPVKALLLYIRPGAEETEPEPGSGPNALKFSLTLRDLNLSGD